jgi:hypothetical protein
LNRGDPITIPTGHKIKHATVHTILSHIVFRVVWRNKHGTQSQRTLLGRDEGTRWLPGHLDANSPEARALVAAQAIVGESPWERLTLNELMKQC